MMGTQDQDHHHRLCDFCSKSTALLYCRADSAKLCLSCDHEVHSTNQLFTKHTRWLLCDTCDSSPVSIFCCTDNTVLCQNCDWEAHKENPSSSSHDRRPLDGFTGCPSVVEILGFLGLDDLGKKSNFEDDGDDKWMDFLTWDNSSVVSIDELVISNDDSISGNNFQAMGVAQLPKNRNAVCGQHKDEILHQLREMSKSELDFKDHEGCQDSLTEFQSQAPGQNYQLDDKDSALDINVEPALAPSHEANAFQWCANGTEGTNEGCRTTLLGCRTTLLGCYTDTNYLVPEKASDVGGVSSTHLCDGHEGLNPVITESSHIPPKVAVRELNSQERDSAISRYKEKKKTRRYEKHIRYESRKVRAESRLRVNGRFAKMVRGAAVTQ